MPLLKAAVVAALTRLLAMAGGAGIWSSPAVSQGTVFITGNDGMLDTFAIPAASPARRR